MEATNELLVCRDVSLGYEGQSVLEHLDLTIRRGDYLCIVGDNGSGKSTLLRGLLGLIQPLSGEIWRSPELRQGSLGYLPQQTRAQRDFPATVWEVVLSGCLNRKGMRFFYSSAQKSAALMNMGKLGILELKDQCYRTLTYLNQKEGTAIVMVTHDLKAALRSARTVLHIGRSSYFCGSVAEYLASPQGRRFQEGNV